MKRLFVCGLPLEGVLGSYIIVQKCRQQGAELPTLSSPPVYKAWLYLGDSFELDLREKVSVAVDSEVSV